MGFFDKLFGGQQPAPQPVDPRLVAVFAFPPDEPSYRKKDAEKALARESSAIVAILNATGETALIAAHDAASNRVLVVTDQRTFLVKRGVIDQEKRHSQVAETKIHDGTGRIGNMRITIFDLEARMTYGPNSEGSFRNCIGAEVATYRTANAICTLIDERMGQ